MCRGSRVPSHIVLLWRLSECKSEVDSVSAINSSAVHRFWFGRLYFFFVLICFSTWSIYGFYGVSRLLKATGNLQNAYFMNFERVRNVIFPAKLKVQAEMCTDIACIILNFEFWDAIGYVPNRRGPIVWWCPFTSLTLNVRVRDTYENFFFETIPLSVVKITRRKSLKRKQKKKCENVTAAIRIPNDDIDAQQ